MVLEGVNPVTWFYLGIVDTEVGTCVHVHGDEEGGTGTAADDPNFESGL